jgi:hypothetical protein
VKVDINDQITEARRWLSVLPAGPRKDACEGVVLTLEFMKVYRAEFYEFMAQRSRDVK